MDIRQLRAFIVVAEELNFRRSAERLAMSQPPLTRLIATLEEQLDTKLFERTTRSVALTGAGVLLLREARAIVAAMSQLESDVKAVGRMKSGSLRIGFSRTAFMARLPAILDEFQEKYPRIQLDLREEAGPEILRSVRDGRFDVGFVEGVTTAEGLRSHPIGAENLGGLMARNHVLARRKRIDFHELKNETIILHDRREAAEFFDRIAHLMKDMPKKPRIHVKAASESCPVLVALGRGIALTIASAQNIAPDRTRFVPIRDLFLPVHVFWRDAEVSPALKTLVSFAIEARGMEPRAPECIAFGAGK